jgi:hypothetical protein
MRSALRAGLALAVFGLAGCEVMIGIEKTSKPPESDASSPGDAQADARDADAAGAGGTAGASGAGGQAGGGTGGATDGGAEDCTNAVDDDGDGKVDCEDPDCDAGYTCVQAPPAGWSGYLRMLANKYDGTGTPENCPSGAIPARYYYEPDTVAQCEACTCDAPSGFSCGLPDIECAPDKLDCSDPLTPAWNALPDCHDISTVFSANHILSCKLTGTAQMLKQGTCAPSTSIHTNPTLFSMTADVCSLAMGGGCGAGACVAKAAVPYGGPTCIRKDSEEACPQQWPFGVTVYSVGNDLRSCSSCSCDSGPVQCSGGAYTFYDFNACAPCSGSCDAPVTVGPSLDCQVLTNLADSDTFSEQITTVASVSGGCAAAGGLPQGTVTTQGPVTICCLSE